MEDIKVYLKDEKLIGDPAKLLEQAMFLLILAAPVLDEHAKATAVTHPKDEMPKLFYNDVRQFLLKAGVKKEWV